MIAYIQGNLEMIEGATVVVEASGVGYEIHCPNPYVFQSFLSKPIRIYTYHYVREDSQQLYGFKTVEEKTLFAKLLNVSGIGPKGALAILGSTSVGEVVSAIEREDDKYLTRFPGVGKKTARQMILDLKGKLTEWLPVEDDESTIFYEGVGSHERNEALLEALEAFKALGYSEREIKKIRPELEQLKDVETTDEYVKKGLALMMKQ